MENVLIVSHLFLWIVLLATLLMGLAIVRQVGVLYERISPMGALMLDSGPRVGDEAPTFELDALGAERVSIGGKNATSTLLFFLSPTCPVCKKLIPILKRIRNDEKHWLNIVLASDGDKIAHDAFRNQADIQHFPYVLSQPLGMAFRISKLPYAVLIDLHGKIKAKGLVNSREQIESLLTASELGIESAQAYFSEQLKTVGAKS